MADPRLPELRLRHASGVSLRVRARASVWSVWGGGGWRAALLLVAASDGSGDSWWVARLSAVSPRRTSLKRAASTGAARTSAPASKLSC